MEVYKIKSYEVHLTECLPKIFNIREGENLMDAITYYIKEQNKGLPKSERIKLEKIVKL